MERKWRRYRTLKYQVEGDLSGFTALHDETMHDPQFFVVADGVMHHRTVVPHHQIVHLPLVAVGELRANRMGKQSIQELLAFVTRKANDGTELPEAHLSCFLKSRDALVLGKNVVVSNTFVTLREMARGGGSLCTKVGVFGLKVLRVP